MWKIEYIFSAISQNEFVGGKLNENGLEHGKEFFQIAKNFKI